MSTPRLATLEEAADLLGIQGRYRLRRTRRQIQSFEEKTGRTILVRYGGEGHGTRYRVSIPALREAAPHLFEERPKAPKGTRKGSLEDVRDDLREWVLQHDSVHERVEDRLDELYSLLREGMRVLGDRLSAVEQQRRK